MKSTLIDAGPLIALFDKNDHYHSAVLTYFKQHQGQLLSTWLVLTEVTHMLDFNIQTQLDFLEWVERGGLNIAELNQTDLRRMITLSKKYQDIPMDLADSSLVLLAETYQLYEIITLDSDYYSYRIHEQGAFLNVLAPFLV